jgi:hypothetical protein
MKKLTVLAVAGILGGSLAFGNYAKAQAVSCEALVEELANYLGDSEERKKQAVEDGLLAMYGDPGEVSSNEYDACMIKNVEEKFPGYTIKIIKHDIPLRNPDGTTYFFVKKEK